ncbi:sensor histidine kinase [Bradyrhizobium elkanii]|uniref:sensor histidine kinase n=1 Tax=Bradyrhizobium elkanii TaxID=29448 RepID=UPI002168E1EF|nr:ATP-binding protein [Bradyrhizobium elkanii]MCS3522197.1 signal transduction histidine kinase [Bradyrhizobium elkanii]MCS4069851.1 signal transduction histidine kinase [Bradyrhizobium elkanii]MCS4076482.1 signal transduction histidine kinase [Bradyrhizobium elkanii]MCW2124960.1 signal transduction histidine kinase [Bradyrhizobium elkanii]MCW2171706.1 signal transduction histidine kinase [Bradyrhizobium elkanii]
MNQISEPSYRALFDGLSTALWELDFSTAAEMLRELRESGGVDFDDYLNQNPAFVQAVMAATEVVSVNDISIGLFKCTSKAELLGNFERFWPEESSAVYRASIAAILAGEANFSAETGLRRLDGSTFDAEITMCVPSTMSQTSVIFIAIADLTKRNQAIEALAENGALYRTFFNVSPASFWQLDVSDVSVLFDEVRAKGYRELSAYIDEDPGFISRTMDATKVVNLNDKAIAMFGGRNRADFVGQSIRRFWGSAGEAAYRKSVQAAFDGKASYQAETRARKLDGNEIDVLFCMAVPPDGQVSGVIFVAHIDISAQVSARSALAQMQAELAHAARLSTLGELTASLAHEVNQPLTAIVTNGEAGLLALDRHSDPALLRRILERVIVDGRRAADIISRIRRMAVKKAPEMVWQSVNATVAETELFLRQELQANAITTILNLAPHIPDVCIDRIQIQQVIANLIVNAAQATRDARKGRPTIIISTYMCDANTAIVTIEDNGPGIPSGELNQIFESFFTTKETGMGMGLPICRAILDAHGGRIVAENRPEGGARFVISLAIS